MYIASLTYSTIYYLQQIKIFNDPRKMTKTKAELVYWYEYKERFDSPLVGDTRAFLKFRILLAY